MNRRSRKRALSTLRNTLTTVGEPTGLPAPYDEAMDEWPQPVPERAGECYLYAWHFFMDHPDWTLVHGRLEGVAVFHFLKDGIDYPHAWCRKGRWLYEPLADRVLVFDFYKLLAGPVSEVEYDFKTACEQMQLHKTYGSWHRG